VSRPDIHIPESLVATLRSARSVAVLTGSGISAESGVPTFREAQTGLWARFDPEELATPEAFARDPRLVWEWYAWRRELVEKAAPNPGHEALVELERRVPSFTLITQNVDGLHRRAGSRNVVELHGNIRRSKCSREGVVVEPREDDTGIPPSCPRCGALLRPDVVWFGETLPAGAFAEAFDAARGCDLFFSVGTSGLVQPAASLPFEALRHGAVVVEINPNETPLTWHASYALRGLAGEVLPALVKTATETFSV
jgi:NAD-dependent protein deacetylase/lipoamidase